MVILSIFLLDGRQKKVGKIIGRLYFLLFDLRMIHSLIILCLFFILDKQRCSIRVRVFLLYFTAFYQFLFCRLSFAADVEFMNTVHQFLKLHFDCLLIFHIIKIHIFECYNLAFYNCISTQVQFAVLASSVSRLMEI